MLILKKWPNMHSRLEKINESCAIIINSCDAYEDVWKLFFSALKENWKECDLEIFLNTESKLFKFDGLKLNQVNTYHTLGLKKAWGGRLLDTLKSIDKEFVIALFDDFVLEDTVNVDKIKQCILWMKNKKEIAVFYFNNIPGKNIDDGLFSDFELLGKRNDYRLNSAPAIWRRERLIAFTGEIDNPWAWEFFGSARTYGKADHFYCAKITKENTFVYNYSLGGAIRRGKWVASVVRPLLKKYNLNIDLNQRGITPESLNEGKYSLKWKVDFFILGFKMIGPQVFIFIYRIFKKKLFKR